MLFGASAMRFIYLRSLWVVLGELENVWNGDPQWQTFRASTAWREVLGCSHVAQGTLNKPLRDVNGDNQAKRNGLWCRAIPGVLPRAFRMASKVGEDNVLFTSREEVKSDSREVVHANSAILATSCFTASMLFWNATRSLFVNFNSITRSTPLAPIMAGTPT